MDTTDSNNNSSPAKLIIRGQYSKIKVDIYVFLTSDVEQFKIWLDFKYRKRRICHLDKKQERVYLNIELLKETE